MQLRLFMVRTGETNVFLARSGGWGAVFDEAVDEGRIGVDDLAARLSKAAEAYAFSVRVDESASSVSDEQAPSKAPTTRAGAAK